MIKWPWLMITLALISATNPIAQYTYDYNHRLKRSNVADKENITLTTTTSKNIIENQKIDSQKIKNTNVRISSTSNVTKSLYRNELLTNNSDKQISKGLKIQQTKLASTIVFPNSINEKVPTVELNKFIPDSQVIEKCSMNESFCIKVDSYPRQDLLHLFRTSKFMSNVYFGVDAINDLETRFSNNLQPFCDSLEEVIFPEAGITKDNEWRYIIQDLNNDNNNYKQGIRVEKCLNAGESCKFSEHLPIGYTTTCVQKYIYKKLVAIKDSKEIYYESFKLPSCCSCMYTVNPDLLTRKSGVPEN